MNTLPLNKRAQIVGLLVEGMSMRAITRLTGVSINTVTKLLVDVGTACTLYQNEVMRDLPCKRIEVDEIWSFCGMKEKNVPKENRGELGYGDVYTWTAIDADTKLVPSFVVGRRDAQYAYEFMHDIAGRVSGRVQITSDGWGAYVHATQTAFGADVDFAQLIKIYGSPPDAESNRRYSPAECTGTEKHVITGNPDMKLISTSYVERQNLTMRMHMRRMTRLTNAFSKKIFNLECAVGLHFMYYNFGRIHKTLRVTPAMEAGLTDHVWTFEEIANLAKHEAPKVRGPYKKQAA